MAHHTEIYRIITTMDGIPVLKHDGEIMQFQDTSSCRKNTKHRTYNLKIRHHSRGLTKDQFFRAKKEFAQQGYINLLTLGRKGDHN